MVHETPSYEKFTNGTKVCINELHLDYGKMPA